MKARGTIIQGAVATVALGSAWVTFRREPEKATGDVVVIDASKSDVSKVRFDDGKSWVEIYRQRGDGSDKDVWVRLAANADKKQPERELRGNEAAGRLLDSFGPLRATRALGALDEGKLKEFGLAPPDVPPTPDGGVAHPPPAWKKRTLDVTARGDTRTFTAGTPPGGFTSYLRDARDGRIYVLGGTVVSDLESASTRMIERALHAFKAGDYDEVVVETEGPDGKKRDLVVQGDAAQPWSAKLASKKSPDKPDETAKNWNTRVFGLFPVDVLGKGELPVGGAPEPKVKVTWLSHGAEKGFLELARGQVTAPPPSTPTAAAPTTPPADLYARSERTAGWIKLPTSADELLKEAAKIVNAD